MPNPEILALIRKAAERRHIPYALLYEQVRQESAFKSNAVSKCGAMGLLQIMPATGKDLGLRDQDFLDPEKNLMAGALYLRKMYMSCKSMVVSFPRELDGIATVNECTEDDFWQLALAAYNGGLGYVIRAINICQRDGLPLCWRHISSKLSDPRLAIKVKGRILNPDEQQILDYVEKIWTAFESTREHNSPQPPLASRGRETKEDTDGHQ